MLGAESKSKKLLLISSSMVYGSGYLDHAEAEIRDLLRSNIRVLFVPFALHNHDAYATKARERFAAMGYTLQSIHEAPDRHRAVDTTDAIFIGGGNTFRLLKALYDFDLLVPIRRRAEKGMPYIGSSAGSVVACPTIMTTNDMPIVTPPSFDALGLVSFQINPHYLDPERGSKHMGETREERIRQFLEENERAVLGLRESSMLRIEGGSIILKGIAPARLFRRGHEPLECKPGTRLSL